ncbi:MAG: tRNA (adenosine(37)-N6)-dimethylallyltransferase MiaA [Dehalococcoidia bacterium]|nr:tRNA (adenosine(37)-N6)-dimethylallyltransferase MiaA [Dehalococcoidia bacterium]
MSHLIAIVGPTAVGKSALAIHLAQVFGGEIVSADSRQVFRSMDIGTAKPSPEERALVPHHLIDVVDPDQDFTVALYQEMAIRAIEDIQRRGRLALLVGGSGLYVRALVGGYRIPIVPPDTELRRSLEEKAASEGYMALYEELKGVDPTAAQRIDPRNVRRVIRALEVFRTTGLPFSKLQGSSPFLESFRTLTIGLTATREDLYRRIDSRVDRMMERGLVQEVKGLLERGYSLDLPAMSGLGYKQIGQYLKGEVDLSKAVQRIKYETHRFARHQYAWFRPNDEEIHWFEARNGVEEVIRSLIQGFIFKKTGIELAESGKRN